MSIKSSSAPGVQHIHTFIMSTKSSSAPGVQHIHTFIMSIKSSSAHVIQHIDTFIISKNLDPHLLYNTFTHFYDRNV